MKIFFKIFVYFIIILAFIYSLTFYIIIQLKNDISPEKTEQLYLLCSISFLFLILVSAIFSYNISKWINKLFRKLSLRKDQLKKILSSINEGIIVVDLNGKIKLCSKNFLKFLNTSKYKNSFYQEIVEIDELKINIDNIVNNRMNDQIELKIDGKIYLLRSVVIEDKNEIIIILFNITETKKIKKIKKNLIANVSHELRTPLTSIKGFVETLEDDINEEHKVYTEIIKRNTERIISIVDDLLTLSETENENFLLNIEKINAKEFFKNIERLFEQKLKAKNIDINIKINTDHFYADIFKFEQVMINLIDNAIKYTEKGSIDISLSKSENNTVFKIKDTGIGIDLKYFDRIFERFYVVDKSRSRKSGGTGLGLSIVKHIIELHNGSIEIDSILKEGTEFIIIIPIV